MLAEEGLTGKLCFIMKGFQRKNRTDYSGLFITGGFPKNQGCFFLEDLI